MHSAAGRFLDGPLKEIKQAWSVSLGGPTPATVPGAELISVRKQKTALPPTPQNEHLVLANGDRIPGKLLHWTDEKVGFKAMLGAAQDLQVPPDSVLVWWVAAPDGVDDAKQLRGRLVRERRRHDIALLRNGDRVEGTLLAVTDNAVRLKSSASKEIRIERNKLAALAMNTLLARLPHPRGAYGRVILANGGRLSLVVAHTSAQLLVAKTLFGADVKISLAELVALSIYQGRAVYLSDLKPRSYVHTPYLGLAWPYTPDASVAGGDLCLGGSIYDKGIGMHSASRLTYDLAGNYQWFETLVGLNDQTGREGSAVIEVLLDGKPHDSREAKELTNTNGPRLLRIDIARAKELTLVVKFGERGEVQGHVDWADAKLIK